MKKIWSVFPCVCVISLLFCGCARQRFLQSNNNSYDDAGKWSSKVDGVSNLDDIACMDSIIAYYTNLYVCFYNIETKNNITDKLADGERVLGISAGKTYFYVLIERDKLGSASWNSPCYIRLYTQDGLLFKEVKVPFQKMFVSDGMIYAYWERDYHPGAYILRTGHIEATHYLSEEEFLGDFPNQLSDWNLMSGEQLQIASKTFYRYRPDGYMHKKAYYCDDKYLDKNQQFYFTEYMDGELATPPEREMDEKYRKQLYAMMKKEEDNWITFASEVDGTLYGVCNIYISPSGFLSQMTTNCIDYSISFSYNESTDTLDKIDEYENVELIYTDAKHAITHKEDGVYYVDLVANREEKVLNYNGAIGVTVRDGLLLVKKNESYVGNGDVEEEEEFYWGKDTVFVKKLW